MIEMKNGRKGNRFSPPAIFIDRCFFTYLLCMVTLYEYTHEPRYWIAHDEDGYWLVPACDQGWNERIPFIGHVIALQKVTDMGGIDLGIPDENS